MLYIYHFLVISKPHERIDLLITTSVNIYQGKLMKQFGNPPKRTPPLSTNPLISEQFFHDPPSPLCPNFKNKNPPPLILGWGETMTLSRYKMKGTK